MIVNLEIFIISTATTEKVPNENKPILIPNFA